MTALGTIYDALNAAIFLPGGSGRLRQALVDSLEVTPGQRVLELGCGTGQVTERLLAAGAEVVAVDELPAMLATARRRAPGATFVAGDAATVEVGEDFDRVVLAFVLHSGDADTRRRLLHRAAGALAADGRLGLLDWALPDGPVRAALWRSFLAVLERGHSSTPELLDGALEAELPAAGLRIYSRARRAGGRTEILLARPAAA